MDELLRDQVAGQAKLTGQVARMEAVIEGIAQRQSAHEGVTGRLEGKIESLDRKQTDGMERLHARLDEIVALVNQARGVGLLAGKIAGIGKGGWVVVAAIGTALWVAVEKFGVRFGP